MIEFKHGRYGYLKHKCRCQVCVSANSHYRKQLREENALVKASGYKTPRLPGEPLIRMLERAGMLDHVAKNMVQRWERQGLPLYWADHWAVHFGWHPVEIWGMDFYEGIIYNEVA